MIAKQVSVFLENKSGRLNEVTRILGEAGINISAFCVADTSDFGVLRMIVPDPDLAVRVLKAEAFSVQTTPVVLMRTLNQPGSLARALKILSDENVFIEYLYAFSMNENSAVVVIRPSEIDKCVQVLEAHRSQLSAE
ncbi:MAG TPA: ACT domain-containing protein [bacterium]|nr:ACT domain-containing protein [bacterium]